MMYAMKFIKQEQTDNYLKQYLSLKSSLTATDIDFYHLYTSIEQHSKLLTIICYEEEKRVGFNNLISKLKEADIKTWIVSGDNETQTLTASASSNLI